MGHPNARERHDDFRKAYLIELARELPQADPKPIILPGVAALLDRLERWSGVTLGLVTGNYRAAVPLKFESVGIPFNRFSVGAFADDAETRAGLVKLAMHRWSAVGGSGDPSRTIVIGDTPRDVRCAQENGCRCLAVATGQDSVADLVRAGADAVIRDFTDPEPLVRWLEDS